jgi:hypothetical protein
MSSISGVIVNKIKTLFYIQYSPLLIHVFYEIMWNNIVASKLQMTVQCCAEYMRFPFRITKARIQTHKIFYTHFLSTATMVARTHLNVRLYLHCLSCFCNTLLISVEDNFVISVSFRPCELC